MIFSTSKNSGVRVGALIWTAISARIAMENFLIDNERMFLVLGIQILLMWLSHEAFVKHIGATNSKFVIDNMFVAMASMAPFFAFNLDHHRAFGYFFIVYLLLLMATVLCIWDAQKFQVKHGTL